MDRQQNSSAGLSAPTAWLSAALVANEPLVHYTVQRQWLGSLAYRDAVQEGRIALWRSLERHDPRRSRLSSYAVVAIERAVWRSVRRELRSAQERLEAESADEAIDLAAALDRVVEAIQVRELLAALPARLRQVIQQHYGLDGAEAMTFRQIGRQLGVSKQRVQQLHVEALLRLADPATATPLRRQLGRNEIQDYQVYLARRRAWQRRGRSRP
jgi:RNA polymerase sigma factor (sigma-70 family)